MSIFNFKKKKVQAIINKDNPTVIPDEYQKKMIQAFGEEGARDILSSLFLKAQGSVEKQPDKNNFKTYDAQVKGIHDMYEALTDYGGEILRPDIDVRVAMLSGEGISYLVHDSEGMDELQSEETQTPEEPIQQPIQALDAPIEKKSIDNKAIDKPITDNPDEAQNSDETTTEMPLPVDQLKIDTEKFIKWFFKKNKLDGSGLIKIVETIEKEGKALIILESKKVENEITKEDESFVKIKLFKYYNNKYCVEKKDDEINKIYYGDDKKEIPLDKCVYIDVCETPRVANVLTQIENYSRSTYDLRKNNHLFGRTTPHFKCQDQKQADALNNDIVKRQWVVGTAIATTAEFSLVSQASGASDAVEKERTMLMKDICNNVGISIHLMNYPELMSNRATAESMLEIANASTKKERLIIKEGMIELIQKAMTMSVDSGHKIQVNNPDGFDIDLPLITLDSLKAIIDIWLPLMQEDIVSRSTLMNQIPGINPAEESKTIDEEKKARMARAPQIFDNNTSNELIKGLQDTQKDKKMPAMQGAKLQAFKKCKCK